MFVSLFISRVPPNLTKPAVLVAESSHICICCDDEFVVHSKLLGPSVKCMMGKNPSDEIKA